MPNKQAPIAPADYELMPGTYTIYKYAEATDNANCFAEDVFEVTVYPLLNFSVEGGTLCRNATTGAVENPVLLDSSLDASEFLVSWFLDGQLAGQGSTYTAVEAGVYSVSTQKLNPEVGAACNYNPTTVEVFESAEPVFDVEVSQPFENVSEIAITVTAGFGEYEYRLDDQAFQNTPRFINVSPGTHLITDKAGDTKCARCPAHTYGKVNPEAATPEGI